MPRAAEATDPRLGFAQHRHGHRRARPLEQVDVDGRTRRRVEPVVVRVAHDPDDGQQTQVAIHVSELDRVADRVLVRPPVARQRFADHRHVRRIGAVALVEDSPSNQRNAENLEVSVAWRRRSPRCRCVLFAGTARRRPSMVFGTSCCSSGGTCPSGRPPSIGRPLVAPTLRTPGICSSRSIRLEKKTAWPALTLGSLTHGSETSIVTILSTRNPGFTSSTFIRLRPKSPAPTTRTNVIAICAATMTRPTRWLRREPACPLCRPSPRSFAQVPGRRAHGGERSEAGGDRRGQEEREHEHRNTDRDAVQPRQVCRRQRHQSGHAPERSQHAQAAAGQRKQERFGEELTDQPSARRAERAANGELTLLHRRLCQQQVRHVRARHQQQESHGAEQDQQRRASPARDRVLQRDHHAIREKVVALLARRVVNAPRDRADVSIRLLDSHAVAEAPDRVVVVRRPARVFAVQIGRQPQIHVRRETKSGGSTPMTEKTAAVDLQVRLREIPRRSEMLPPVAIADKNGGAGALSSRRRR